MLHLAVELHHVAVVKTLLEHRKKNVNARDVNQSTPLHYCAAKLNDVESIDLLVGAGADLEAQSDDGPTPLH